SSGAATSPWPPIERSGSVGFEALNGPVELVGPAGHEVFFAAGLQHVQSGVGHEQGHVVEVRRLPLVVAEAQLLARQALGVLHVARLEQRVALLLSHLTFDRGGPKPKLTLRLVLDGADGEDDAVRRRGAVVVGRALLQLDEAGRRGGLEGRAGRGQQRGGERYGSTEPERSEIAEAERHADGLPQRLKSSPSPSSFSHGNGSSTVDSIDSTARGRNSTVMVENAMSSRNSFRRPLSRSISSTMRPSSRSTASASSTSLALESSS